MAIAGVISEGEMDITGVGRTGVLIRKGENLDTGGHTGRTAGEDEGGDGGDTPEARKTPRSQEELGTESPSRPSEGPAPRTPRSETPASRAVGMRVWWAISVCSSGAAAVAD